MLSPFMRSVLLLLCAGISVLAAYCSITSLLVIACIFSAILLFGYFRSGTVKLALSHLRNEEYAKAETILGQTTQPDRLDKRNQAYYYFVKGFLAREKDNYTEAKACLELSLTDGIRNQNDIAMALLALADMEMVRKDKNAALHYFNQLKGLKVKKDMMPPIRKMQAWLGA
ncbi:MAG: hypothetical protein QM642_03815 [Edaphocola sp.]